MVFLKEFFKKLILKKSADVKSKENYPICKELIATDNRRGPINNFVKYFNCFTTI